MFKIFLLRPQRKYEHISCSRWMKWMMKGDRPFSCSCWLSEASGWVSVPLLQKDGALGKPHSLWHSLQKTLLRHLGSNALRYTLSEGFPYFSVTASTVAAAPPKDVTNGKLKQPSTSKHQNHPKHQKSTSHVGHGGQYRQSWGARRFEDSESWDGSEICSPSCGASQAPGSHSILFPSCYVKVEKKEPTTKRTADNGCVPCSISWSI